TGEAPVVAFGRVCPGLLLWPPLAVVLFYLAFIWGGWAANAGESLFPLIFGRARTAAELPTVKALGAGLLLVVFVITLFGKKISRTLEIANWIMVVFILVSVAIIAIIVVPAIFGMMLPTMIVYQLRQTSGVPVTDLNIPTYAADQLGVHFGPFLRTWALVVGFFILFSTQLGVFDLLSRQFVDGAHAISAR